MHSFPVPTWNEVSVGFCTKIYCIIDFKKLSTLSMLQFCPTDFSKNSQIKKLLPARTENRTRPFKLQDIHHSDITINPQAQCQFDFTATKPCLQTWLMKWKKQIRLTPFHPQCCPIHRHQDWSCCLLRHYKRFKNDDTSNKSYGRTKIQFTEGSSGFYIITYDFLSASNTSTSSSSSFNLP